MDKPYFRFSDDLCNVYVGKIYHSESEHADEEYGILLTGSCDKSKNVPQESVYDISSAYSRYGCAAAIDQIIEIEKAKYEKLLADRLAQLSAMRKYVMTADCDGNLYGLPVV